MGRCHREGAPPHHPPAPAFGLTEPPRPDLRPPDERTALDQRLDAYRAIVAAQVAGLDDAAARTRVLPASDLTPIGILKHLAWAEDRWFQGRLAGVAMPPPWDRPGADEPDPPFRSALEDTVAGVVDLYAAACARSSAVAAGLGLDAEAAVPSFGAGSVNLRWVLVHMIDETARHAGHLDLLLDALGASPTLPRP